MLMNSVDPQVAEQPGNLIVRGRDKAAADWDCLHTIIASLRKLESNETLLVDSGKPAGTYLSDSNAPRVLIVNSPIAAEANNADGIKPADHERLLIPGLLSAANWTYAGTQTFLPVAYEALGAVARKHFSATLAGRLVIAAGMGAMGGAQARATTLRGGAFLGIDIDAERIKRHVTTGYCDVMVNSSDEALRMLKNAVRMRQATSVGLIADPAGALEELATRGVAPDLVTTESSAAVSMPSITALVQSMLALQRLGSITLDFGSNATCLAYARGVQHASEIPGFAPEYLGDVIGSHTLLTWTALSGEPADITRTERLAVEIFPQNESLRNWFALAKRQIRFQGLPARVCWIEHRHLAQFGAAINEWVAKGELRAPVVISGERRVSNGGASLPEAQVLNAPGGRQTLRALPVVAEILKAANSASWASAEIARDTAVEYPLHIAYALVADGTREAGERIERVLAHHCAIG